MKIYISNLLPKNLNSNFVSLLEKNKNILCEKNTYTELVSRELGIITVNSNNITKHLEPNFHPVFEQLTNYNNTKMNLLFDLTEYKYTSLISRFPTEYIYMRIIEYSYKLINNSNLVLKIKYIEEMDEKHCSQLVPIDYYFEYTSQTKDLLVKDLLSNIFFKNDFNVFLSMLN
jgi:hypothetical protein